MSETSTKLTEADAAFERTGHALDLARQQRCSKRTLLKEAEEVADKCDTAHKMAADERDKILRAEVAEA